MLNVKFNSALWIPFFMPFSKIFFHLTVLSLFIGATTGCDRAIEKVSDQELLAKYSECQSTDNPSAAMGFACENYKRECERRRKETGRYICY